MFKRNVLYKHDRNTDVAFEFHGVSSQTEEGQSLIVTWWNIVHKPEIIRQYKTVWIKREEKENWKEFVPGVSARKTVTCDNGSRLAWKASGCNSPESSSLSVTANSDYEEWS